MAPAANAPPPSTRWRRWQWFLATTCALLLIVLAALPLAIRWGAVNWLRDNGHPQARIDDVDCNLFTGRLEVSVLDGGTSRGDALDLAHFALEWEWMPLVRRRIQVADLSVRGGEFDLRRAADGTLHLGRLRFPPAIEEAPPAATANPSTPWHAGLERLELRDVTLRYADPLLETEVVIRELHLDSLASWRADVPSALYARVDIDGEQWTIDGTLTPFSQSPALDLEIALRGLLLRRHPRLLQELGVEVLTLEAHSESHLTARYHRASNQIELAHEARVDLAGLHLQLGESTVQFDSLSWRGTAEAAGPATAPRVEVDGALRLDRLQFAPTASEQRIGTERFTWKGHLAYHPDGDDNTPRLDVESDLEAQGLFADQLHAELTRLRLGQLRVAAHHLAVILPGPEHPVTLRYEGEVELAEIAADTSHGELQEANLAWRGSAEMTSGDDGVQASAEGNLRSTELHFLLRDPAVSLGKEVLTWNGTLAYSSATAAPQLALSGDLEVAAVAAGNTRTGRNLLQWEQLALAGIDIRDGMQAQVASIRLEQLQALENDPAAVADAGSHVLSLQQLRLDQLQTRGNQFLDLGELRLEGLQLWLARGEDGAFEYQQALPQVTEAPREKEEASAAKGDAATALQARIGAAHIGGDNRIVYLDRTVEPAFRFEIHPFEVHLEQVDSTSPDGLSPLTLRAKSGRYATLEVDGEVGLFAARPTLHLTGTIQGIDLPPATGLAERNTGYRIKSGLFDADVRVDIDAGMLDSLTTVRLNKLELVKLKPEEKDALTRDLGLPLNTALNLLRDSDDDIRLKIPVEGDLSDPDIDIGDAVRKAVFKGLSKAISTGTLTYLATLGSGVILPVGAALAAGKAYSLATALRFAPVPFAPGDSQLTAAGREQLDEVARLLTERPTLRLTLCGFASPPDRDQLLLAATSAQPGADAAEAKAPPTATTTSAAATSAPPQAIEQQLLRWAQERGDGSKEYLTLQHGIAPQRLLVCSPEIDATERSTPRVEVSL